MIQGILGMSVLGPGWPLTVVIIEGDTRNTKLRPEAWSQSPEPEWTQIFGYEDLVNI